MLSKISAYIGAIGNLGFASTLSIIFAKIYNSYALRFRHPKLEYKIGKIRLRRKEVFLYYRIASSDINVISQVFIHDEYRPLVVIRNARWIMDCGANAGYSTVYLLNAFPNAHVAAIEPDERNFKMLELNTRRYKDRINLIRKAVWSDETSLKIVRDRESKGAEWATVVRECHEGEKSDIQGDTIDSIVESLGINSVDIMKIDIEGAEKEIFRIQNDWMKSVCGIAIELHDEEAARIFRKAISQQAFRITQSHELTIAVKPE